MAELSAVQGSGVKGKSFEETTTDLVASAQDSGEPRVPLTSRGFDRSKTYREVGGGASFLTTFVVGYFVGATPAGGGNLTSYASLQFKKDPVPSALMKSKLVSTEVVARMVKGEILFSTIYNPGETLPEFAVSFVVAETPEKVAQAIEGSEEKKDGYNEWTKWMPGFKRSVATNVKGSSLDQEWITNFEKETGGMKIGRTHAVVRLTNDFTEVGSVSAWQSKGRLITPADFKLAADHISLLDETVSWTAVPVKVTIDGKPVDASVVLYKIYIKPAIDKDPTTNEDMIRAAKDQLVSVTSEKFGPVAQALDDRASGGKSPIKHFMSGAK